MIKKIFRIFELVFGVVPDFFSTALIIYLLLFLLENLFPGFVSNNFDLNILLWPLMILGFLSAFTPTQKKEEQPVNKTDYIMVVFLSLLAFIVLWYKTKTMGTPGLVIALGGSILVEMISLVLLLAPEEPSFASPFVETSRDKEALEDREVKELISRHNLAKIHHWAQLVLFRGVRIPIIFILLAVFIMYFLFNKSQNSQIVRELITPTVVPTATPTIILETPTPQLLPTPNAQILKETPITVLNGSTKVGSASAMVKYLRSKQFNVEKVADADRNDYKNALVRFREQDLAVAEYLINTIKDSYPVVDRLPLATDSSQIILILGKP